MVVVSMQMDWLGALEGVVTHTSGLWISGPALSKQSSSSCFWYTDGLYPVKDLLLNTEGDWKCLWSSYRRSYCSGTDSSKERSCSLALGHMSATRCLMTGLFVFLFPSSCAEMALLWLFSPQSKTQFLISLERMTGWRDYFASIQEDWNSVIFWG